MIDPNFQLTWNYAGWAPEAEQILKCNADGYLEVWEAEDDDIDDTRLKLDGTLEVGDDNEFQKYYGSAFQSVEYSLEPQLSGLFLVKIAKR